jgi:hypothetical protein
MKCHPKKSAADKHARRRYIEEEAKDDERDECYDDNNDNNDDGVGGKCGYYQGLLFIFDYT